MRTVAIIGGGPGGLMTAYSLQRRAGTAIATTIFEASARLGGKLQTRMFDSAPVAYEAGIAECYNYETLGHDPLRQLVNDLDLNTFPTHSTAVVLNGRLLRDDSDVSTHFGSATLKAVTDFRSAAADMLPLANWYRGFVEADNQHPWARRTCQQVLDDVVDPVARTYLKIGAHSDMATEPHLANGLIGLRNFLKSVPGYGAQYSIEGGMERLAQRLADRLTSSRFELEAIVTALSRQPDGRYTVRFRRGRTAVEKDFDAVVLALPYNQLHAVEMTGERLRRAMAAHIAHYDSPGHYLRVSVLFDRPFWRRLFTGSWIMLDAFGGCCVYDESAGRDTDGYGVLGWLLAGTDALRLSNAEDRTLTALVLDSLPDALYDEACSCAVEAKVHRWAGAVSGQPGGFRVRPPREAHQPEPVEHPGLAVVGDYLFDSTLNGVLRSASIATQLLLEAMSIEPAELLATV